MWGLLQENRSRLNKQYEEIRWNEESGLPPQALEDRFFQLAHELDQQGVAKPVIKAKGFAFILDHAQLAAEPCSFLQDHIRHGNLLQKQRDVWNRSVMEGVLREERAEVAAAFAGGFYRGGSDFGHTAPDWNAILTLGCPGLLHRIGQAYGKKRSSGTLSREEEAFYTASTIVYESFTRYMARLATECRRASEWAERSADAQRLAFCAQSLDRLSVAAPGTMQEALQLSYLYHILQEEVEGERLRSFGGIDRLYGPFFKKDLAAGRIDRDKGKELLQHMMLKFFALTGDWLYGEPMYIGGVYPDGSSAVDEMTDLVIDAFDALNTVNPKFHVRVAANSPKAYVERVCDCIRRGNSSFVFLSDACAVPMMLKVGATLEEARDYVPIGCYEPVILGKEVGCTGGADVNLAKALELALHDGLDPVTKVQIGPHTGAVETLASFERLCEAVRSQIAFGVEKAAQAVCHCEQYYMEINPSPLLSATMAECVERGLDAYRGGAKYNHSSVNGIGNATLADSLVQIKKLVYDQKTMTLAKLVEILDRDWLDEELLRARIRHDAEKYGNNREQPDALAAQFTHYFAELVNGYSNARGGRFKAALISINHNYSFGRKMGATPDGRKAGEAVNKNLSASVAMDRSGVTAHMKSVCSIDHSELPNGSVMEVMLHPTAVAGEEGLKAFAGVVWTYIALGGFAIHLNVSDAKILRAAQAEPERYQNLQIRVCGWNQFFTNLTRVEQDDFIRQAELIEA